MTIKETEKKSLALNALDKIHLVEKLLSSLDKPDPEIEKAWIKEAEERFAAYEKGELNAIPLEKVLEDIERK